MIGISARLRVGCNEEGPTRNCVKGARFGFSEAALQTASRGLGVCFLNFVHILLSPLHLRLEIAPTGVIEEAVSTANPYPLPWAEVSSNPSSYSDSENCPPTRSSPSDQKVSASTLASILSSPSIILELALLSMFDGADRGWR